MEYLLSFTIKNNPTTVNVCIPVPLILWPRQTKKYMQQFSPTNQLNHKKPLTHLYIIYIYKYRHVHPHLSREKRDTRGV